MNKVAILYSTPQSVKSGEERHEYANSLAERLVDLKKFACEFHVFVGYDQADMMAILRGFHAVLFIMDSHFDGKAVRGFLHLDMSGESREELGAMLTRLPSAYLVMPHAGLISQLEVAAAELTGAKVYSYHELLSKEKLKAGKLWSLDRNVVVGVADGSMSGTICVTAFEHGARPDVQARLRPQRWF